jgi:hypothetical protein
MDFIENLVTPLVDVASIQRRAEATGSEAHFWLPQKKKLLRERLWYEFLRAGFTQNALTC